MNYEAHPAANIFPMMPGDSLRDMAADIRENGLMNPIEIFEGKIIDGRNRYKACQLIGMKPRFHEITTGEDFDAVTYVLSLNLHRRHLTTSQRAMVAVEVEKVYAEEAKKRQIRKPESVKANLPEQNWQARDKAAEMLNVGGRSVSDAKRVMASEVEELPQMVREGTVSVSAAAKVANLEPEEQHEVIEEINQGGKPTEVIKAHVAHNSGNNEWYTPSEFIEAARRTMGSIDLDPASNDIAQQTVKAGKYFTVDNCGLAKKWTGNVWMNPPYAGKLVKLFAAKVVNEPIDQAVVLVNNATETGWFQLMAEDATAICFPAKRIKFLDPDGNPGAPLQGQAILYIGGNVDSFEDEFSGFGFVMRAEA